MPGMEIPSIHVEDTTLQDAGALGNNWELFRRISALLDNSLDLSHLSGISLQPEQVKAAMSALSAMNQQQAGGGTMGSTDPNLMSPNNMNSAYSSDSTYLNNRTPNQGWQPFSSTAPTSAAVGAGTAASTGQIPLTLPQALAQLQNDNFIQGAISNRTLEQLTESMTMRPYRAIRAEQNRYSAPYQSEHSSSSTSTKPTSNYGHQTNAAYSQQSAPSSGNNVQYHGQQQQQQQQQHQQQQQYNQSSNLYGQQSSNYSCRSGTNPYAQSFNPYFDYNQGHDYSQGHDTHGGPGHEHHDYGQTNLNQYGGGGSSSNTNNNLYSASGNSYTSGGSSQQQSNNVGVIGDRDRKSVV